MRQAGKGLKKKMNLRLDENGNVQMSHVVIVKRAKKQKEETANKE